MGIRSQPTLGHLFDLSQQLREDSEASDASLRHRDRPIGRELKALESRPAAQILSWLRRIRDESDRPSGNRLHRLHGLGLLVLALAGALVGWGAAAVIFNYDGTHPVNVIHVLAFFVFLQLLLLLFFALSTLPAGAIRWVPGMRALRESFELVSPGRLQRLFTRYLPAGYRDTASSLLGKGLAHQRLYGAVDRWITVHSSQVFAVFFHVGALASVLYLVAFSDLAFAWSTTLQLESADLRRWTDLLSAPWASFFPDARPSAELIETTRYFRLQEGSFPAVVSPVGLGGWWPFLVMCMAVYGLLPRLLTWLVARARLRGALRRSFRNLPGTGDLLARLNSELVESHAENPDDDDRMQDTHADEARLATTVGGQRAVIVDWSEAASDHDKASDWLAHAAGLGAEHWHSAGGTRTPEQDQEVISAAAKEQKDSSVLILVKAWEPPMAEILDFLRALRRETKRERMLLVAPVGRDASGALVSADPDDLKVWQQSIGRVADPWLRLLQLGGNA
ncbi:MAG TPA: DUF2868 domain-containing protein [Candidatus Krumholzibacteria bacterium]|jgi:hypothetical protein